MSVRAGMFVEITSPGERVTVGPDRRVTININAWGVILTGGGGGDNNNRPPSPPNGDNPPPAPPHLQHGKDANVIQSGNREVEAGRVLVRLGGGHNWREATKMVQARRWRFTGTAEGGGPLEISVRAEAPTGFQGQKTHNHTVNVVVDRDPPVFKIDRLPRPPQIHKEEVPSGSKIDFTVSGSAEDKGSGVREVLVGVGEASDRAEMDGKKWKHTLTLQGFGEHDIRARAVDRAGNINNERRRVETIDTGPPTIVITQPRRGTIIGWPEDGDLTVEAKGKAKDDGSGVRRVMWRLGDNGRFTTAEITSPTGSRRWWEAKIPIPDMGEHVIQFRCEDNARNEVSDEITIHVEDLTPPKVRIIKPSKPSASPHEVLEEEGGVTVGVEGTAEDPITEVAGVEWSLNGSQFEPAHPVVDDDWSEWKFSVHLDRIGEHLILVRATDVSGNTSKPHELRVKVREVLR